MLGIKDEELTPRYLAVVVTRSAITRVEFGAAKPIEEGLALRHRAVVEGASRQPKRALLVHGLAWSPLVKHLPAKTSIVFVSPDAALNGVPPAALRHAWTNRILLEEYPVAVVPHGRMLLDRLTEEKRKTPNRPTVLAMGGSSHDKRPGKSAELAWRDLVGDAVDWSPLAGTARELLQFVDFQLDPKLFDRLGSELRTAGARSPMVLSGLDGAGANIEDTPKRGIVTADAIVGIDLGKLNLAVLSACEPRLGDVAGGEGVYGLVRAIHVAGTHQRMVPGTRAVPKTVGGRGDDGEGGAEEEDQRGRIDESRDQIGPEGQSLDATGFAILGAPPAPTVRTGSMSQRVGSGSCASRPTGHSGGQ